MKIKKRRLCWGEKSMAAVIMTDSHHGIALGVATMTVALSIDVTSTFLPRWKMIAVYTNRLYQLIRQQTHPFTVASVSLIRCQGFAFVGVVRRYYLWPPPELAVLLRLVFPQTARLALRDNCETKQPWSLRILPGRISCQDNCVRLPTMRQRSLCQATTDFPEQDEYQGHYFGLQTSWVSI